MAIAILVGFGVLAAREARTADASLRSPRLAARARALHECQRYDPIGPVPFARMFTSETPKEAQATLLAAVRLAPTWAMYYYALGVSRLAQDETLGVKRDFDLARRFAPTYPGLLYAMAQAWLAASREKDDPALVLYSFPLFRRSAALDPSLIGPALDSLAPLVPDVRKLAPLVPDLPICHLVFGRRLLEDGQPALAIPELAAAAADHSLDTDRLYFDLGRAHLELGNVDAARAAFVQALAVSAEPDVLVEEMYGPYHSAGKDEEGRKLWDSLTTRFGAGAHFNLGRCFFDRGKSRWNDAYEQFSLVGKLGPSPRALEYLARIEIAWRDDATAVQHIRELLVKDGETAFRRYLLAEALHGMKKDREAVRQIERATELAPKNAGWKKVLLEWLATRKK